MGRRQPALEELDEHSSVQDVALVYKDGKGRVKVRQTSDLTAGKGALSGAVLGGLASILVGPLVGMAAAGTAAGAIYGKIRDKGVSDKLMKLAGEFSAEAQHEVRAALKDQASA